MPCVNINGVNITYERDGSADAPAILAIMGISEQLVHWPEEFYQPLVQKGYQVIRFDNRDAGLSSHFGEYGPINIKKLLLKKMFGIKPSVPYSIEDMTGDAFGLLDALGIECAHIVGVSLGGVIAQVMAMENPDRVISLTLISTTSDNPDLPKPSIFAMKKMMSSKGMHDRDSSVKHKLEVEEFIGGTFYPEEPETLRKRAENAFDRMHYPEGTTRQLGAALTAGRRDEKLKNINVPSLVIHGGEDPLFSTDCGLDLAAKIPNSKLVVIDGMGHGMSSVLMPVWLDMMIPHFGLYHRS